MHAAIVRVTIDRATGRQLEEQIIGYEEIDEDTFYRPLVEVLGKRVLEALQNNSRREAWRRARRGPQERTWQNLYPNYTKEGVKRE